MTDAETILRDLLDTTFNGADYQVKPITSGGANYTSALFTVSVSQDGQQTKLFGKVAIVGEKMRAIMNAENLYSTEQFMYIKIQKIFNDLQDKYEVPEQYRFVFPKFYGCNPKVGDETILLEDLTASKFGIYDRFKSVDWEHAASSVAALARFHALSFAYQKDHPEEYKETLERLMFKMQETSDENAKQAWEKMIGSAISVLNDDDHRDKLVKLLAGTVKQFAKFKLPLSVAVLTHGDYRPSNLLFRKVNGVLETMVVDYQTVHAGCPVTDLLYFIFTGSDEEFRRQHYDRLLEHYYTELTMALERLQIDVNDVYPKETYYSEVKEMLPDALRISVVILPIVMVDAESAPQVAGDADIGTFALKPNELFAKRFNGIVRDCARWGVL